MAKKSFLESELDVHEPPNTRETAFFHIIPAPLEATVSYGRGTAQGPAAILAASDQLELWDGASMPAHRGIYTQEPVICNADITRDVQHLPKALQNIKKAVRETFECGAMPILLGGEHTVTFAALAAIKEKYGTFGIIQFDAHADLRNIYEGIPWSHACVMRRAVQELDLPLVQFAVRALSLEEIAARRQYNIPFYDAAAIAEDQMKGIFLQKELPIPEDFPQDVYLTFDVDAFDPSIMPATGTPVPGGIDWYTALDLLRRILADHRMLGFDVVEFAPIPRLHYADFTAASLVYALMGLADRSVSIPRVCPQ